MLLLLNALLLTCAILRILAPHFAIMFVLSVGLTISYFMYVTITLFILFIFSSLLFLILQFKPNNDINLTRRLGNLFCKSRFMSQLEAIKRDANTNSPSSTISQAPSTATTTTSTATLHIASKHPCSRASEKPEDGKETDKKLD